MTRSPLLAAAVLSAMPVAVASAQTPMPASGPYAPAVTNAPAPVNKAGTGGAYGPSPYTPVRWNEDYSYLKDPSKRSDLFDPIKYIPLGKRDDVYLSLGGQLRERYEYFNNNTFGTGPQDDNGYFLHRGLLNADLHVGPYFRAFGQIKASLEDAREGGPRPTDADEFDVQQLFVDGTIPLGGKDSVTVRFGRQDLIYGAQRLISPLDWTNVRRTFEGVKVSAVLGNHTVDAFLVRPVVVNVEEPNDGSSQATFSGVYDTISLPDVLPGASTKLDLYGLVLNQNNLGAVGTGPSLPAESDTYTIGARFSTNPKPWDLDVEVSYQFGQIGADAGRISAYQVALEGGY
ncbi:MAG: hypothetical protein JWO31_3516, partial [Phycisphaerales bacterium]|nr:hypothetical protein [Phycisphaerales bacterium]